MSPAAIRCLSPRVRVPFTIVPNGVDPRFGDLAEARPRTTSPRILFAHRLEPRKGFPIAVDAFARLASAHATAELIVVGQGPDLAAIERLSPVVRGRVRVLGSLSRDRLLAEFAAASVFLAPAVRGESFGVVLVEAMAAGVPVVASDIPGYREVLADGGILTPVGDAIALAAAVGRLLDSPNLSADLGARGRRRAATFSWGRVTDAVEGVYRRATAASSRRSKRPAI